MAGENRVVSADGWDGLAGGPAVIEVIEDMPIQQDGPALDLYLNVLEEPVSLMMTGCGCSVRSQRADTTPF